MEKLYDSRDYLKQQVTEQLKIISDKCENLRRKEWNILWPVNALSISANKITYRFITSVELWFLEEKAYVSTKQCNSKRVSSISWNTKTLTHLLYCQMNEIIFTIKLPFFKSSFPVRQFGKLSRGKLCAWRAKPSPKEPHVLIPVLPLKS